MSKRHNECFQTIKNMVTEKPFLDTDTVEDKTIAACGHFEEMDASRSVVDSLLPKGVQLDLTAILQANQIVMHEFAMAAENLIRLNQIIDHLRSIQHNNHSRMSEQQKLHQTKKQIKLESDAVSSFNCIIKSRLKIELECREITDAATTLASELQEQIIRTTAAAYKQLAKAVPNLTKLCSS